MWTPWTTIMLMLTPTITEPMSSSWCRAGGILYNLYPLNIISSFSQEKKTKKFFNVRSVLAELNILRRHNDSCNGKPENIQSQLYFIKYLCLDISWENKWQIRRMRWKIVLRCFWSLEFISCLVLYFAPLETHYNGNPSGINAVQIIKCNVNINMSAVCSLLTSLTLNWSWPNTAL